MSSSQTPQVDRASSSVRRNLLVQLAALASRSGFDVLSTSDHLQPWQDNDGHSGQAWVTMGATGAQVTRSWMGTDDQGVARQHGPGCPHRGGEGVVRQWRHDRQHPFGAGRSAQGNRVFRIARAAEGASGRDVPCLMGRPMAMSDRNNTPVSGPPRHAAPSGSRLPAGIAIRMAASAPWPCAGRLIRFPAFPLPSRATREYTPRRTRPSGQSRTSCGNPPAAAQVR